MLAVRRWQSVQTAMRLGAELPRSRMPVLLGGAIVALTIAVDRRDLRPAIAGFTCLVNHRKSQGCRRNAPNYLGNVALSAFSAPEHCRCWAGTVRCQSGSRCCRWSGPRWRFWLSGWVAGGRAVFGPPRGSRFSLSDGRPRVSRHSSWRSPCSSARRQPFAGLPQVERLGAVVGVLRRSDLPLAFEVRAGDAVESGVARQRSRGGGRMFARC